MVESVEPRYRIPAAKTLQVTNQAVESLHLLTYYFLDDEGTKTKRLGGWPCLSDAEVDRYHEDARRRLTARCRGLLEVVELGKDVDPCRAYFQYNVQYLHRTVRDFLFETSEMQTFFEKLLPCGYVAQQELCKAFLRLMDKIPLCQCGCDNKAESRTTIKDRHRPFEAVLRQILIYAEHMWKIRSDPQIDVLRQAERIVLQRPKQWRQSKATAFVGLAVQYGLPEYVRLRLEECPALLRERSRPLLHYALVTNAVETTSHMPYDENVRVDMIASLLRLGAPVERRIWAPLVLALHENKFRQASKRDVVALLALLVEHGANLREEVVIGHEYKRPRETGRAGDLNKREVRVDQTKSVRSIITSSFSPVEVETILRHRPVRIEGSGRSWLVELLKPIKLLSH